MAIKNVLSDLADLKATLGAPPLTGSLPRRRSLVFTAFLHTLVPLRQRLGEFEFSIGARYSTRVC
jgi:hypothetical protein